MSATHIALAAGVSLLPSTVAAGRFDVYAAQAYIYEGTGCTGKKTASSTGKAESFFGPNYGCHHDTFLPGSFKLNKCTADGGLTVRYWATSKSCGGFATDHSRTLDSECHVMPAEHRALGKSYQWECVKDEKESPKKKSPEKESPMNTILVIVALGFLALCCVGGGVMLYMSQGQRNNTPFQDMGSPMVAMSPMSPGGGGVHSPHGAAGSSYPGAYPSATGDCKYPPPEPVGTIPQQHALDVMPGSVPPPITYPPPPVMYST